MADPASTREGFTMTEMVSIDTLDAPDGEPLVQIRMHAPRANALEPSFLDSLHRAFDELDETGSRRALLVGGRNFSTGGDVGRFHEAAQSGDAQSYAQLVVPPLQALVMRMLEMPVVFAACIRGATTGGSAGLVFASDLVVAAPDAFLQPYYSVMGYAPDGGWTALLPELVGAGLARSWVMANRRNEAVELERIGLVDAIDAEPEQRACAMLAELDTGTALATKAVIWNSDRRAAVEAQLDAEAAAFQSLIGRPETLERMRTFLQLD